MFHQQNDTPFPVTSIVLPDISGVESLVTIAKASFSLEIRPKIIRNPGDWLSSDRYYGDADTTSLQHPADFGLLKPATDIIVQGLALAPDDRPVQSMDVSVQVGDVFKRVTVTGDRYWQGDRITPPEPFVSMPMVYERAFGGRVMDEDNALLAIHEYNPVGVGMAASYAGAMVSGEIRLPNLEDPAHPIHKRSDRPLPAGFGAVPAHWEPRLSLAGTYDQSWLNHRAPWLPDDFNPFWLNCGSRGLVCSRHLTGGEPVVLSGMHPEGAIRATIPHLPLQAVIRVAGVRHISPLHIDTIFLEPNDLRVTLTLRGQFPLGRKIMQVDSISVETVRASADPAAQSVLA